MTLDFTRIGQIGLGYMGSALAKRQFPGWGRHFTLYPRV